MNDQSFDARPGPSPSNTSGVVDVLEAAILRRRFVVWNVVIITSLGVILSLSLPKWYKSTASILPPQEQGLMSLMGLSSSSLRSLPFGQKLGGLGQRSGAFNYLAILNSRTAMEAVVKKFDLVHVYDEPDSSLERAIKDLQDRATFEIQNEDDITIEVVDRDPQRAADIANFFVEELNAMSIRLATQEGKSNREFIEKRLRVAKDDLAKAENALRSYQERSKVIMLPDQTSGNISAVAELYALRSKKDVELAILSHGASEENPLVQQLRIELNELDKKLAAYPAIGLESVRLYRDALTQQKIVEYLTPLYEQAKIEEQKDVPALLVLDKAVPAERKFKPKRIVIILTAVGLSLLVSLLVVLGSMYVDRFKLHRPEQYGRWRRISDQISKGLRLRRPNL